MVTSHVMSHMMSQVTGSHGSAENEYTDQVEFV